MTKSDFISVLITFLVGLFAGGYLFLTVYAPKVETVAIVNQTDDSGLAIVGDMYGGCGDRCFSFKVFPDGSYRYLYYVDGEAEQKAIDGNLSRNFRRSLAFSLTETELEQQSQQTEGLDCASYVDGIDVLYGITLEDKTYKIDSCGTSSDSGSDLWKVLSEIWGYPNRP